MNTQNRWILTLFLVALLAGCIEPPTVVQGTVTSYDPATETLVMTDELAPATTLTLSLKGAEVGAEPSVGDTVRVAYRAEQGKLAASRVMNLTRQSDVGGGGH